MKRVMKIFGAAAVCLILLSASALAFGTTITSVTPDKNVGVFESTEAVSFTASLSNATAEKILVIAKDINGEEVDSRTISVPNGATSVNIRFDSLSVGWYRLYICDISGNIVYNKYTAFVVTEPYSRRTVYKDSHLALDTRVGEYGGNEEKFGDAYKLMGISQTRERAYYGDSYGGRTTLGTTSSAFSALGIDTLAVWTPENRLSEYRENLNTVYSWQKLSASVLNDRINSWEIVNEPDNRSDLPADLYSAYLKASALAVYDADPNLKKSFGAVCDVTSGVFAEYMMQNGVMNYADTYNVHTHQDGSDKYTFRPIIGNIVKNGRLNSTIYGEGTPVWVSESGLRMNLSTGNIPTQNSLKTQAAYVITSFMEAIEESGTDKYFFFLGTHYIEDNKEYGIFSENEMPYPAVSTISTLTYYLGKGDFLGMLKGVKGNTKGLVFDTGKGRAVVLYNNALQGGNVQIDTMQDATVVDLVGGKKTRIPNRKHDKINIHMGDTPIIVVLSDDEVKYCEKKFENNTENKTITNTERLVIQPLWREDLKVKKGKYILEQGQTYNIIAKVYNMSQTLLQGSLNFNGSNQVELITPASKSYRIARGDCMEIPITIKIKDNATPLSVGYFSISGTKCTPSVGVFKISDENIESVIDSIWQMPNFYTGWKRNDSASSRSYTTVGTSAKFTATWNTESSAWIYPKKALSQNASGYDGVYFKLKMDSIGNNTSGEFNINVYLNGIIANAGTATTTEKTFYVSFNDFTSLDVSNITEARIGFTQFGGQGTFSYTVSDFGFFTTSDLGNAYERPEISINLADKQIYRYKEQPKTIVADITGELSNIKVYVNYKEFNDFSVENNRVIINTKNLESGAKNIIVTGRDAFNYAVFDQVSFCIGNPGIKRPTGIFF